jgi:hypothetical protein
MRSALHIPRILGEPVWHDSEHICALADEDRHLGHAVQTDRWHAYDGTKLDAASSGFRYLGEFDTALEAKQAIEISVNETARRTRTAGSP